MVDDINKIADDLNKVARSADDASAQIAELRGQLTSLLQTAASGKGIGGTISNTSITQADINAAKILAESQQKTQNLINARSKLSTGLTGQGLTEAEAQKTIKWLESMGVALDSVSVKTRFVEQGFKKLATSFTTPAGKGSAVGYLGGTSDVLGQEQYQKYLDQTKYSLSNITQLLGQVRSKNIEAFAKKQGFGLEDLKTLQVLEPSGAVVAKFNQLDEASNVMRKLEISTDKFGVVTDRTNKRLLSFTDSVIRNTSEVLRWSIGVGIIYGGMAKLQELVTLAIDNEAKLADVTVTLGNAQRAVNDIFADAADVANLAGESINDVLEAYTMTYRAVGGVADPIERTTAANKLLNDSMILNKLSGLDSAESIDVLSGSLRQLQGKEETVSNAFGRGTELLDKWVATTRRANVDLATLATAFSVTGETALSSGMSIEELNAVIAVLSEKIGGLGGKETGNAVRALIGGVYQEQAAEILNRYGIAVKDSSDQMRDFLDISEDIYNLYRSGLISEDQLNKISYVLGGGVRRGQQYRAFLSDQQRIQEIVVAQENATGAAQEALARKTDTTQTAITKLGNSFQTLAQILGTDGGVLDALRAILTISTGLVDAFSKVSSILGSMTVPAAMLALGAMYFRGGSGGEKLASLKGNMGAFTGGLATNVLSMLPGMGGLSKEQTIKTYGGIGGLGYKMEPATKAATIGERIGSATSKYGLGILAGSLPALSRYGEGDKAGAAIQVGGAIAGALLTKGSVIGSVIGSAIAGSFVDATKRKEGEFEEFYKEVFLNSIPKEKDTSKGVGLTPQEQASSQIFKQFGLGFEGFGRWAANLGSKITGESPLEYAYNFASKKNIAKSGLLYRGINQENLIPGIEKAGKYIPENIPETESAMYKLQKEFEVAFSDYINGIAESSRKELQTAMSNREIKPTAYKEELTATYGLEATLSRMFIAINGEQAKTAELTEDNKKIFQEYSDVILNATTEDRDAISTLVTEILDLNKVMEELKGKAPEVTTEFGDDSLNAADAAGLAKEKLEELLLVINAVKEANVENLALNVKFPEIVDLTGYSQQETRMIENLAKQWEKMKMSTGISQGLFTQEDVDAMYAALDPFWVQLGDSAKENLTYGIISALQDSSLLDAAANWLEQMGKIAKDEMSSALDFQTMDVTSGQLYSVLTNQYPQMLKTLEGYGYQPDETSIIPVLKDGIVAPLKYDWKIVQYLLSQILDTEKKQLDGLYNLPSDSTFFVPSQTLQMAYNAGVNSATPETGGGSALAALNALSQQQTLSDKIADIDWSDMFKKYTQYSLLTGDTTSVKTPTTKSTGMGDLKLFESQQTERDQYYQHFYTRDQEDMMLPSAFDNSMNKLLTYFQQIFGNLTLTGIGTTDAGLNPEAQKGGYFSELFDMISGLSTSLTTNLRLEINSHTTLLLDGKTVAEAIKPYLWEDMIKYEGTTGTVTRVVAI